MLRMGLFNNIKSAWGGRPAEPAAAAPQPASSKPVTSPESEPEPNNSPLPQKRILFVEGDAAVCGEFVQLMQQRRPTWEIVTAPDAAAGLARIATGSIAAVIASARLTGKSGVEFLNEVGRRHPGVVRLIRYAPEDKSLLRGFSGWAPLHLTRGMDAAEIEAGLECAFQLGDWTAQEPCGSCCPRWFVCPRCPTSTRR